MNLYFNYNKTQQRDVGLSTSFTSDEEFQLLYNSLKSVMKIKREEIHQENKNEKEYYLYF